MRAGWCGAGQGVTRRAWCVISGLRWCSLWFVTAAAGVLAEAGAGAWLKEALAGALEASEGWERTAAELREENARLRQESAGLREELARRDALAGKWPPSWRC